MTIPQKQALSQMLFSKMHDWLNGHRDNFNLFSMLDKGILEASTYDDLSMPNKDLLVSFINYVEQGKPHMQAGLDHFTYTKEKYMMEVAKSLIS
jgi:hypothetical protein